MHVNPIKVSLDLVIKPLSFTDLPLTALLLVKMPGLLPSDDEGRFVCNFKGLKNAYI